MLHFNKTYFGLTAILFLIEVVIALFVKDKFIRPYLGDLLVVILIYCFVKSFVKISVFKTALGVLLFAFTIEILQYCSLVKKLKLQHNTVAKTVIGTSFSWEDILAYIAGILIVLIAEKQCKQAKRLQ
ncbi:DUF2809 domain-containing protein [Flavobacterium sp. TBRC 19031]|uniref:ribosomal maturation YjgA family protein n=1 Tax=Flavobacterium mekongense TaxID=3379707 RepID=UPI0039996E61